MKPCSLFSAAAIVAATLASSCARSQAIPAARRGGALQVGAGYSSGTTDEVQKRIGGISIFGTFDLNQHLGVEVDAHLLSLQTPGDYAQKTYLAGVRYVYRKNRYEPYGKVLGGIAQANAQLAYADVIPGVNKTYGAFAPGAGLDIRIPHNLTVRAVDFEYQIWPGYGQHALTPTVLTFGVMYRIR